MAAPAAPDIDKVELKKLLIRSKKEPVNCAVAMSKGQQALIVLDKIKQPRAILKELEKKFGDVAMPRWGTAFVDVDTDPKLMILTLNKPTPGFARKMKKTLKGTGFAKVEVRLEDGTVDEAVGDDEEEGEEDGLGGASAAADGDASAQTTTDEPATTMAPPAAQSAVPFDVAGLTKRLTDVVKRMLPVIAADPSRQGELKTLATQAQAAIKGADPSAESLIDQLEDTVNGGGQSGATAPADPAAQAALASTPKLWLDTIATVESDCAKLKDAIRKDFAGEAPDVVADIEKNLGRIDQVCGRFDKTLAELLQSAAAAPDQATRNAALAKARSAVIEQIKYAASEPLIGLLDDNPFGVSPGIKQKLATVLTQVTNATRVS